MKTFKPTLESLEGREVPSASPWAMPHVDAPSGSMSMVVLGETATPREFYGMGVYSLKTQPAGEGNITLVEVLTAATTTTNLFARHHGDAD